MIPILPQGLAEGSQAEAADFGQMAGMSGQPAGEPEAGSGQTEGLSESVNGQSGQPETSSEAE